MKSTASCFLFFSHLETVETAMKSLCLFISLGLLLPGSMILGSSTEDPGYYGSCDMCKTVTGGGPTTDGNYEFYSHDPGQCEGGCLYSREGDNDGSLYCFRPGGDTLTEPCDDDYVEEDGEEEFINK